MVIDAIGENDRKSNTRSEKLSGIMAGVTSDISEADSDDIADMLGDVDKMDDGLFRTGLGSKSASPQRKISGSGPPKKVTFAEPKTATELRRSSLFKQDRIAGEDVISSNQGSHAQQTTMKSSKSALDDLFGPTRRKEEDQPKRAALDDLFGPTPRRKTGAPEASKKKTMDWLGGGAASDSESDEGFKDLIAKKKQEKPLTSSLPFLEAESPMTSQKKEIPADKTSVPEKKVYNEPVKSSTFLTAASESPQHQNTVARFKEEKEKMDSHLEEERRSNREERQALISEWREKLQVQRREMEDEIERLKQQHKEVLERMQADHNDGIERIKASLSKEIEAVSTAFEQAKSYHEISAMLNSATEKLSTLTTRITDMHDSDEAQREATLAERERRVRIAQERLDRELVDLSIEKEKVHSILAKLDLGLKTQETRMEHAQRNFEQDKIKFDAEKIAFEEYKLGNTESISRQRDDLNKSKEAFLREQQAIMQRVLAEQERLQQERIAFTIQRDSDLGKIRKEALTIEEKIEKTEEMDRRAQRVLRECDNKQRQLMELEQVLSDEKIELERERMSIDRERDLLKIRAQELAGKEAEIRNSKSESGSLIDQERTKWAVTKSDLDKHHHLLREKAHELLQKERDLQRQIEKLNREPVCLRCRGSITRKDSNSNFQVAEKPYDSPNLSRAASIRTKLRAQTSDLEQFLSKETAFINSI